MSSIFDLQSPDKSVQYNYDTIYPTHDRFTTLLPGDELDPFSGERRLRSVGNLTSLVAHLLHEAVEIHVLHHLASRIPFLPCSRGIGRH